MRETILTVLLIVTLGVIAFDRVAEHARTVKAAGSKTLKLCTFSTIMDVPLVDGQISNTIPGVTGTVAGSGKCYVLVSEE
jgi:hypothetical protein